MIAIATAAMLSVAAAGQTPSVQHPATTGPVTTTATTTTVTTGAAPAADPEPLTIIVRRMPAPAAPAPPVATAAVTAAAAHKNRTDTICRTSIETGSLVAKRTTCLTAKQWEYVDQAHRDEARKMMMDNMGKPGGN